MGRRIHDSVGFVGNLIEWCGNYNRSWDGGDRLFGIYTVEAQTKIY